MTTTSRLSGFRNLTVEERLARLAEVTGLRDEQLDPLRPDHGLRME